MKKLLTTLSIALLLSASAFANTGKEVTKVSNEFVTVYVPVSNVYTIGTSSEIKAESAKRKAIVSEWNKKGFAFSKVQRFSKSESLGNGLFIVMIQARK